jgi:copper(I)-binding protein
MLMDLGAPLTTGDTFRLVLKFASSGDRAVEIEIRSAVEETGHEHHGHH